MVAHAFPRTSLTIDRAQLPMARRTNETKGNDQTIVPAVQPCMVVLVKSARRFLASFPHRTPKELPAHTPRRSRHQISLQLLRPTPCRQFRSIIEQNVQSKELNDDSTPRQRLTCYEPNLHVFVTCFSARSTDRAVT